MDQTIVLQAINDRKEELYDLLCRLIRINSENFGKYGNERECPQYIAELCRELGLETDFYSPMELEGFQEHPDYRDGRNLQDRFNVTARWKGQTDRDAMMIMGHSDTVPIGDRTLWNFDPLLGEVRDGKIWGRGACDDKYALATGLFLIRVLKDLGFQPKKNLLFTAYCDEEAGGSHGALAAVLRYPAERIVNMDCKNFQIWNCASGGQCIKYRCQTEKPQDSARLAAEALPIILRELDSFGGTLRQELEENRFYGGTIIPATSLRYFSIRAGGNGNDLGVAEVVFSIYTDRTKEEIENRLKDIEKRLTEQLMPLNIVGGSFTGTTRFFHYAYAEPDCKAITDLQQAAKNATGRDLTPCASCLSDLSVILKHGSPEAFAFGIGRDFNDAGGAHQPNEYITCADLLEYAKIMAVYIIQSLS